VKEKQEVKAKTVGVIGLGIMGSAMASNLVRAGFRVYGFDVLKEKRAALGKAGGTAVSSLKELNAPVVITSLPNAEALKNTALVLQGKPIVIETSTLPIEDKILAKEILQKKGITLLDCPLSGTGAQAKTKDLVVLGSRKLVQSLMQHHLIDEYVLLIHPLILGSGSRLFPEEQALAALRLIGVKTTPTGVVVATYQSAA